MEIEGNLQHCYYPGMGQLFEEIFDFEGESILTSDDPGAVFCMRAKRRAIRLANHLIDENGAIGGIKEVLTLFQNGESIGANGGYSEGEIAGQFERVLKKLLKSPKLIQQIQGFRFPIANKKIENWISITLGSTSPLTHRDLVWAILSALLCPLRQSVGSCFATAPAILVQQENIELLLEDLVSLVQTGLLKRTFGGQSYVVPVSPSIGISSIHNPYCSNHFPFKYVWGKVGMRGEDEPSGSFFDVLKRAFSTKPNRKELLEEAISHFVSATDHLLLKMWEFTFASFVDVKTEFSQWNLFTSLGIPPDEEGGIGQLIYLHLQEKLDETHLQLAKEQTQYEEAFDQLRSTEVLFRSASSQARALQLEGEYRARLHHFQTCEEARNRTYSKAENISQFFSFFIDEMVSLFPSYFQEIYDPQMLEVSPDSYEDSPAGFRLLYKHGRAQVGSWTFIEERHGYVEALKDFFRSIEYRLIEACKWEKGKGEIAPLITKLIHYVDQETFLFSAFERMAKVHHQPIRSKMTLSDLDRMEKKPWAYTSGGNVPTLLKTYFKREGSLSQERKWVESAEELLIFFIETLKGLSPKIMAPYLEDRARRMLAYSPTHVFSIFPGAPLFAKGWEDRGFTYTWVRDDILLPRSRFYRSIRLSFEEQQILIEACMRKKSCLSRREPTNFLATLRPSKEAIDVATFAEMAHHHPLVHGVLWEMLPFISSQQIGDFSKQFGVELAFTGKEVPRPMFHDGAVTGLKRVGKGGDLHREVSKWLEEKGIVQEPLIFADTNWPNLYFAFVVNPATCQLELWRTDRIALTGMKMVEWQSFLDGSDRNGWGLFHRREEYC